MFVILINEQTFDLAFYVIYFTEVLYYEKEEL